MTQDTSRSRVGSPTVVLIGTLDTEGDEYAFLRDRLRAAGVATLVVDVGTHGPQGTEPDVSREEVAATGGVDLGALTDRGAAVAAMCGAAPVVVRRLFDEGPASRCRRRSPAGTSTCTT